jgi:hypothetical protein
MKQLPDGIELVVTATACDALIIADCRQVLGGNMKSVEARTNEFLTEIDRDVRHRLRLENGYRLLHIGLGVIIAACGFLTAAASQTTVNATFYSSSTSLLTYGLLSAICAIINQIMTPGEAYTHHQNVRRALAYIRGEVKFRNMDVKSAQALRSLALTNPAFVWKELQDTKTKKTTS